MEMPSLRRTLLLLGRAARLRCPHCGGGAVLERGFRIRGRCAACGFRYERSDENYFGGAVFVNYMLCGGLFVLAFLVTLAISWPAVPWDLLAYGMPVSIIVLAVVLYPASKVLWLALDVLVRPVTPAELE